MSFAALLCLIFQYSVRFDNMFFVSEWTFIMRVFFISPTCAYVVTHLEMSLLHGRRVNLSDALYFYQFHLDRPMHLMKYLRDYFLIKKICRKSRINCSSASSDAFLKVWLPFLRLFTVVFFWETWDVVPKILLKLETNFVPFQIFNYTRWNRVALWFETINWLRLISAKNCASNKANKRLISASFHPSTLKDTYCNSVYRKVFYENNWNNRRST